MKTGKLLPPKEATTNGQNCGVMITSGLQLITQLLKMSFSNALKTMTDCSQTLPVIPKTLLLNITTWCSTIQCKLLMDYLVLVKEIAPVELWLSWTYQLVKLKLESLKLAETWLEKTASSTSEPSESTKLFQLLKLPETPTFTTE